MRNIYLSLISGLLFTACSLDRVPYDALSTATFPKTEADVEMLAVGCYDDYANQDYTIYNDVFSDNGYCAINTNWAVFANGTATHAVPGINWYNYTLITRCNNFLHQVTTKEIHFNDPKRLEVLKNEVRFLRAWRYYMMVTAYGDIPLVTEVVPSLEDAKLPATPETDVVEFILDELNDITKDGALDVSPKQKGRITRGAALALKVRLCLFYKKYDEVIDAANEINSLGVYNLYQEGEVPYSELFKEANEDNCEIILAVKKVMNDYKNQTIIEFCNVIDGGWSAFVPIQSLIDAYEMKDGLTIEEAQAKGEYNPEHPYKDRDPRFYATIVYPGATYMGQIVTNDKFINTGYTFKKYSRYDTAAAAIDDKNDINIILMRYADILMIYAEARNERLDKPDQPIYDAINEVRNRPSVKMPLFDKTKDNFTKEQMRERIRHERRIEFAGEGWYYNDIRRWKIAKKLMNGSTVQKYDGSIIERRIFNDKNYLFPLPQQEVNDNPNLLPNNPGW